MCSQGMSPKRHSSSHLPMERLHAGQKASHASGKPAHAQFSLLRLAFSRLKCQALLPWSWAQCLYQQADPVAQHHCLSCWPSGSMFCSWLLQLVMRRQTRSSKRLVYCHQETCQQGLHARHLFCVDLWTCNTPLGNHLVT